MKVIIAGSRDFTDWGIVSDCIRKSGFTFTEVVSGGARGVDHIGEGLAELHGYAVKVFPADWDAHGKGAGPIRNKQMADYADALIAIWDGKSPGTRNMIQTMHRLGKPTKIFLVGKSLEE